MLRMLTTIALSLLAAPIWAQAPKDDKSISIRSGNLPPLYSNTPGYFHSWESFPTLTGRALGQDNILRFEPEKGVAQVVVFLASWCLPCQQLMPEFKKMEKNFENRFTKLVYVFAHDTQADALGFKKYHAIGDNAIMGTPQILKDFNQPELPSIYISDRHKWLVMRKLNTKWEDLKDIENFLLLHTAN